jgi:hypothetical protein
LECGDGRDHQALEEQGERGLAASKTTIEKANAGDDEPDDKAAEDSEMGESVSDVSHHHRFYPLVCIQVGVVELIATVLSVHIDAMPGVATPRVSRVVLRLRRDAVSLTVSLISQSFFQLTALLDILIPRPAT